MAPTVPERGPATITGVGCWVKLPAGESVEILAAAGVDFVVADLANSALTIADASRHVVAARASQVPCLVRLPEGSPPSLVGRMLDTGADGVVVPHVSSAAEARTYVDAAFFAPSGTRGMGGTTRGGRWLLEGLAPYLGSADRARRTPLVSIMVEDRASLDAVDEIAGIEGLGQVLVGPADLSAALGVPGQVGHELVLAAMDRVVAAARAAGVSTATSTGSAAAARALFARGFDAVVVSNDTSLLGSGARATFAAAREAEG